MDDWSTEEDRRRDGEFADRLVGWAAVLAFLVLVVVGPGV